MPFLVLLYHRTPMGAAESVWDVPFDRFCYQIILMKEAGVTFVPLSEISEEETAGRETHVAISFDDGHASNEPAFEFLSEHFIRPAAFIVRNWAKGRKGYLSTESISRLARICEFGSHGSTHVDLTTLSESCLKWELESSREFLEDASGSAISSMALPGGCSNSQVIAKALISGYRLIANSTPLLVKVPRGPVVNRFCITNDHADWLPVALASASRSYWVAKSIRVCSSGRMRYGLRSLRAFADAAELILLAHAAKGQRSRVRGDSL